MSIIRILPADVANRIAAGEVIERPASVVKELVENAIDAGATRVIVHADNGGSRLVGVMDDGCGMDREDAVLCLEAHATSKIRESADVGQIRTLGFRGEALPSISAVSRFRLRTRRRDDPVGTEVLVETGTLRDIADCGCAPGTDIRVEHLFANMPARRKFLKGANTEDAHIQEVVLLQALAHPEAAFELRLNGREIIHAGPAGGLPARVAALLGKETFAAMLPVDYEEAGIRVTGFLARPGFTRASRKEQRIFVNGRPAAAEVVFYGLREAYHTLVLKGRYPPVVLYIDLAPERVDVNVHPAKREVRFRESRLAGQVVAAAARKALRGLAVDLVDAAAPAPGPTAAPFRLHAAPEQPGLPLNAPTAGGGDAPTVPVRLPPPRVAGVPQPEPERLPGAASQSEAPLPMPPPAAPVAPPSVPDSAAEIAGLRVIGSMRSGWLVAEGSRGLVLVDLQAAHRRVLFEQLLQVESGSGHATQALLMPVTVDLGHDDAAVLRRDLERLATLGFEIEPFGGNTFLVIGVPARFPGEDVSGLLRDMLDDLRDGGGSGPRADVIRVAKAACRSAVRSSDSLDPEQVRRLLRDLARTEMPYTCPHGKPVMINIPFAELERRFGRRS